MCELIGGSSSHPAPSTPARRYPHRSVIPNPCARSRSYTEPSVTCNAPGGEHRHIVCTHCGSERVELLGAGEL